MIVGLKGSVIYKEPSFIHFEVQGVVYEVFISLHSFSELKDEKMHIFTTHILREDADLLYGFTQMSEKKLFERVIKINGIGPKVAMAICSTYTAAQFAAAIGANDIKMIQKVPGIGPKSAGRILVELNGFDLELVATATPESVSHSQAFEALESLGFKKEKISKALNECSSSDTATLVKDALKLLQKL